MVFQKHHVWLRNIKFNKSTDNCYKISNSLLALPYRVHTQWEDLLDSPIPWKHVFRLIYNTSLDSSSRYFHLKIDLWLFANKNKFKHFRSEPSDLCRFCEQESESSPHLFGYCLTVARFWTQLQQLYSNNNKNLKMDLMNVLFIKYIHK